MSTRVLVIVWTLAMAVAAGGLAVVLTSERGRDSAVTAAFAAVIGLSFVASGLVALARRPENRIGKLLVLTGFLWFVGSLAESDDSLVFTIGWTFNSIAFGPIAHLFLSYPSGHISRKLDRVVVVATYALVTGGALLYTLFTREFQNQECPCPENAFLVYDSETISRALWTGVQVGAVVLIVTVLTILARRWWFATRAFRAAITPIVAAAFGLLGLIGSTIVLPTVTGTHESLNWLVLTGMALIPLAFLYGMLRTRLARTAAARLLVEVPEEPTHEQARDGLRRVLGDPTVELRYWDSARGGYVDEHGDLVPMPPDTPKRVTTPIDYEDRRIAALTHDAVLLEEPELLEEVIAAARMGLEKDRTMRELRASDRRMRALLEALPDNMYRLTRDGRYLDVRINDPSNASWSEEEILTKRIWDLLPAELADRVMAAGTRVLDGGTPETIEYDAPRADGVHSSEARVVRSGEDEVLIIVRDVTERKRQEDELRASRARIVEAGDAERRRLERNLHDGAQQRLVALSIHLRLAQAKLREDPDAAEQTLRAAGEELAHALEELRELARGIHPAVLTDRGLAAALESLADRAPLPVQLDAVPEERLPPPVEAAAFYVVSEALANVAKYAQASSVSVRVQRDDGVARIEVADDGVGGADPAQGTGLRGLADRVEALDGRLEVESAPGAGTRLRAEIPVA